MSIHRARIILCGIFLVIAGAASADSLTTTNGKKLVGKLAAVDGQGVTFTAPEGSVKMAGKEILLIDLGHPVIPPPKDAKYSELELTDGSTFRIAKFAIKGKRVVAELLPGPKGTAPPAIDVGMETVYAIMRGAEDLKSRDAWKKILAGRGKRDLYVVREAGGLNHVSGTILGGNAAGDVVNFEREDGTRAELRLSRATGGLVFSQPPAAQVAATLCKVIDVFGNSLIARSVEIGDSGVTVTTVNGVAIHYDGPAGIARLDYGQGNVAYLSDLEAQVEAPEPAADEKGLRLNVSAPYTRDQCIGNEPLRLGSESFAKGVTIAPDVRLTYTLGGDYREFKATIGMVEFTLDSSLEARLTIETDDGRVLYNEVLRRKDKPRPVVLDVKGVKLLRVSVEADLPVNGNRVVLAEARVQK